MGFLAIYRDLFVTVTRLGITFLLVLTISFQATGAVSAKPLAAPTQAKGLVPDSLLYSPPQDHGYLLVVEKVSQKAYLYRTQNLEEPLKVYPCSTGENTGPKSERNDKRTPEGVYFVTDSFERKDLSSTYGDRAFPLDYPNMRDRKLGRRGYGIWIHGTDEELKPRDTNGCIVFTNEDIRDLSAYISRGHTPIVVTQEVYFVEKEQLLRERAQIRAFIQGWLNSWKQGHIDLYMSFYDRDFNAQGKSWLQWCAYKKWLSERYGPIDIAIDNLQIIRENGVVLAKFNQNYRSNRFYSFGQKRLYLQQKSPEWKITDEFFQRKHHLPPPPPAPPVRESDHAAIEQLIATWQQAWQGEDVTRYMACYSDDFSSRGLTRARWKQYKTRINGRYTNIQVTLSNLTIEPLSATKALVSFDQDYRSDQYHDWGKKTMRLTKKDGTWKIQRETWLRAAGEEGR
jgi:murein L,D-transpeptidase YafK